MDLADRRAGGTTTPRARVAAGVGLLAIAAWAAVYVATVWDDGVIGLAELREQRVVYVEDGRASSLTRPVDPGGRLCSQREGRPGFALP